MTESVSESSTTIPSNLTVKKSTKILHVDDDPSFLKVAKQCLDIQGEFEVDTASSVNEALEKLKKTDYDAVVSDYQMPGKDGLQFLKELRADGNSIPFVVFTGKGREEVAIKALNLGADRYLSKTGDPETVYCELAHALSQAVERRSTQLESLKREARLNAILESSPEAITVTDLNGNIVECNQAAVDMHGFESKENLVGKNAFELIAKKDREKASQNLKRTLQQKSVKNVEYVCLTKDGREFQAELSASVVRDASGKPEYFMAITKDITERKALEDALQDAKQKWTSLTENTDDVVMIVDSEGIIQYINRTIPPYTPEGTIGKTVYEYVPREQHNVMRSSLKETFETGVPLSYVVSSNIPKIGTIWFETKIVPVKDDEKTVSAILISTDITELKNTEERLKETNKKLEVTNEKLHVVGGLTRHDVRNKLSAVTGNAYLLRRKLTEDPEALEQLNDMEVAVRVVEKIFEFAGTYEKLGVEQPSYMDIGNTVDEAVPLFSDLKSVKIVNECHGLTVLADSLLRQLFYNLIDNSLKYGEKLSLIRVYYEEKNGGHVDVIYVDDGVGIPHAAKPKLFDEGYTTGKGSGYGLYLVKKMMEVYGWTISETGTHGKGAKFIISIPRTNRDGKENYILH